MKSRPAATLALLPALAVAAISPAAADTWTGSRNAPLLSPDGRWSAPVRLAPPGELGGRTVATVSWLFAYDPPAGTVEAEICVGDRCMVATRPEVYDDRSLAGAAVAPLALRFRWSAPGSRTAVLTGGPVRVTVTTEGPWRRTVGSARQSRDERQRSLAEEPDRAGR
ncbi:flagellar protein FlhE [Chthonobacter rhizosphaerae]|uniref:flagellar protein FlhE n=1 Tax=Chthonobacter rhizosphaerae TaxID=2735553 RepID=UPI0015EF6D70|nr:flagellar protein FlhE [Chthonobacter rhizosphaerae]